MSLWQFIVAGLIVGGIGGLGLGWAAERARANRKPLDGFVPFFLLMLVIVGLSMIAVGVVTALWIADWTYVMEG